MAQRKSNNAQRKSNNRKRKSANQKHKNLARAAQGQARKIGQEYQNAAVTGLEASSRSVSEFNRGMQEIADETHTRRTRLKPQESVSYISDWPAEWLTRLRRLLVIENASVSVGGLGVSNPAREAR